MKSLSRVFKFIKRNKLKSQKGFSLVELMVVVAIIGILAAIAIPNYQKFQARSKQVEARTQLSGIYTSQTSFAAEWAYGSPNLEQIGYDIDGSSMLYNCGWNTGQLDALGNDINKTTRTVAEYRGPVARTITNINTFDLNTSAIGSSVNKWNAGSWDVANAADASELDVTAGAGAITGCTWNAGPPTTCTGPASCSTHNSDQNGCNTQITAAATEGSFKVDNSNPGTIQFTIGCKGDIEGDIPDEWTMNNAKVLINTVQGI